MRRTVGPAALVALTLLLGVLGAVAAPAQAAPAGCTGTNGYPQRVDATVQVSSTNPEIGSRIEVSGSGYCHDEDIAITLDGVRVGSAHTDATGAFDPPIRVTGRTGDRRVCAAGETRIPANRDCLTITARAASDNAVTPDGGGTAFTGTRIALLVAIAAVLLLGGLLLARAGRRRRVAA